MANDKRPKKVGYGHPPKEHRFKKGQSGNPRGRPKQSAASSAETVAKVRDEQITLTIDGRKVTMSALEAALRRTVNVTLQKGQARDLEKLLKMLDQYGAPPEEETGAEALRKSEIVFNKLMDMAAKTAPRPSDRRVKPPTKVPD